MGLQFMPCFIINILLLTLIFTVNIFSFYSIFKIAKYLFLKLGVFIYKKQFQIGPFPFLFPKLHDFISFSIGGLILDTTVSDPNLVGIVVYTPVINGKNHCFIMMWYLSVFLGMNWNL